MNESSRPVRNSQGKDHGLRHKNVAIFVPHNGCPHQCSFCNQREITGQAYQPTAADVTAAVETARNSLGAETGTAEIAFFGGSFTAIDREYMKQLLDEASLYVKSGEFYGIRISTRPDAVDEEILDILVQSGVTAVELGAQSMNDRVLSMNGRGHTAADVIRAAELIRSRGISLGLQMMTGLYGSDAACDKATAKALAALHPDTVRIYPTVVLKHTLLDRLYREGLYQPQTVEQAVPLCAELLTFFEQQGIRVIRLGLHSSESLKESMTAGAFHPAFRELCESCLMLQQMRKQLALQQITGGKAVIYVHPGSVSKAIGQKKENLRKLKEDGIEAVVLPKEGKGKYEVEVRPA